MDDPGGGEGEREPAQLSEAERVRFARIAETWLERRLERAAGLPKADQPKELKAIAWGAGRRIAAGLLDAGDVVEAIWAEAELLPDLQLGDIDRAIEEGRARGFDPGPLRLDFRCAGYPMTDFGIGERFRDRYGADFRFTVAKGWLGWDGRRWKVFDQEKEAPPAELIAAVFDTVRAIQREARLIRGTRAKLKLIRKDKQEYLDLEDPDQHALDHYVPKGKSFVLFSSMLAAWGRQSETSGKPAAIAALARRWLTVPIEEFDRELLAVNVMNGTLRFAVEELPDGRKKARIDLDRHRREDLITKLAPVPYDREADCPLYDGMFAWAQPDPTMRRYLHQVGGYASTGDTGEHKLWFNYGRGRNGKSTTIDSWCSALGDYSGTIGIESFLDQGIKKRGDAASPDLAKLGGVRMLRASEPEREAKLNSALIKAATGGEPMSVRALHRGFFDLEPRFKLLMSGNSKPSIPDTDDGIWGRMKLIPWLRNIDLPEPGVENWPKRDTKLLEKIKARELPGVFRRLVDGLVDWLENGLTEPQAVKEATEAYRDQSDPLARFLRLCTVADAEARVQSSLLHEVFCAWAKAAGEREWSNKGFSNAMAEKGWQKKQSDGMKWLGLRLVRSASDFVDENGKVREGLDLEPPPPVAAAAADPPRAQPPPLAGDSFVPGFDDPYDDP